MIALKYKLINFNEDFIRIRSKNSLTGHYVIRGLWILIALTVGFFLYINGQTITAWAATIITIAGAWMCITVENKTKEAVIDTSKKTITLIDIYNNKKSFEFNDIEKDSLSVQKYNVPTPRGSGVNRVEKILIITLNNQEHMVANVGLQEGDENWLILDFIQAVVTTAIGNDSSIKSSMLKTLSRNLEFRSLILEK